MADGPRSGILLPKLSLSPPLRCRCVGMAWWKPFFRQPGRPPYLAGLFGPGRAGTTTPGVPCTDPACSRLRTRRCPARPGPALLVSRGGRCGAGPVRSGGC